MSLHTFRGGVHPADGKCLAKEAPLTPLFPGEELTFPLSMHIGAPAKPVVEKGERVLKGQLLAEAGGFVSAPVYASVSGTVKAIEPRMTAVGTAVTSVILENDGMYEEAWPLFSPAALSALSPEEIKSRIQTAGIVGMGGAGFPTHVKISPKEPEKIDTIIANCAECEPYITADYRRMLENPEALIGGLKALLAVSPNAVGVLAIEDNKPDCADALSRLVREEPRISVMPLVTKYPQGAERNLIYAVTGRSLNSRMLPADVGCIVDNVETLIAVHHAVTEGKPLISRTVTVSGDAAEKPGNFLAPIGMSQEEVVKAAGGFSDGTEKIISGGPMMGFAMMTLACPVTKTTSAILGFREDVVVREAETPCINCGRCVSACPERLVPTRLAKYARANRAELFEKWYGTECVECGCCSFVCPAKKPLKQEIAAMKKVVLAQKKAAAK